MAKSKQKKNDSSPNNQNPINGGISKKSVGRPKKLEKSEEKESKKDEPSCSDCRGFQEGKLDASIWHGRENEIFYCSCKKLCRHLRCLPADRIWDEKNSIKSAISFNCSNCRLDDGPYVGPEKFQKELSKPAILESLVRIEEIVKKINTQSVSTSAPVNVPPKPLWSNHTATFYDQVKAELFPKERYGNPVAFCEERYQFTLQDKTKILAQFCTYRCEWVKKHKMAPAVPLPDNEKETYKPLVPKELHVFLTNKPTDFNALWKITPTIGMQAVSIVFLNYLKANAKSPDGFYTEFLQDLDTITKFENNS